MEIKEFVKNSIKEITEAAEELGNEKHSFSIYSSGEKGISFDLAVTLKKSADGKIGAEIFNVVGAKAEGNISHEAINRIKFVISLYNKNGNCAYST